MNWFNEIRLVEADGGLGCGCRESGLLVEASHAVRCSAVLLCFGVKFMSGTAWFEIPSTRATMPLDLLLFFPLSSWSAWSRWASSAVVELRFLNRDEGREPLLLLR